MEQFPSMKARQLLRILQRGPLNYVAVDQRRRGSHRLLRATGRKDGVWWATNSGDFGLIAAHEDKEQLRENVRIAITDCFGEEVEITEIFDNQAPKTQLIH